jgi:phospholipase C
MSTRREFLQRAALLAGGSGLAESLLAAIQKASTIEPANGSTYLDAEHVVILMQENRSFDHSFGRLRGVRGFNDPRAVTLPDQNPVWFQSNSKGETYAPFRLDIKETKSTWLGSLPHGWPDQSGARSEGNQNAWLQWKASSRKECVGMPLTLGYYEREDIPFYYALADAFTVCDQYFCSSLTGTTPNRLYLWSGTIREEANDRCKANVYNSDIDYGLEAKWKTFPERLEDAGVAWKIYQNELSISSGLTSEDADWLANFTDNPIEWFEQFNAGFLPTHRAFLDKVAPTLPDEIAKLEVEIATFPADSTEAAKAKKTLRQKKWWLQQHQKFTAAAFEHLTHYQKALHARAFCTNSGDPSYRTIGTYRYQDAGATREMKVPKGDILHQFRQDVKTGQLPAVSWIVSPEYFSDHAGAPWYGSWYVAEVMNILTANPEIWKKTIFVLTYDENDGHFDHVAPFVAPDPKRPNTGKTSPGADGTVDYVQPGTASQPGPIGLGFRVPFVIASPWSRGGYVNSQVCDHTSVLQLLEGIFSRKLGRKLRETNISPWRRSVCGDLSSVFRSGKDSTSTKLDFPSRDSVLQSVHKAQFKKMPAGFRKVNAANIAKFRQNPRSEDWMPRQEPGTRPSTALPYQLYATGSLQPDVKGFAIRMSAETEIFGSVSAGSGFHVYTPKLYKGKQDSRTRAYAVAAGESVEDVWDLEGFADRVYHLNICGPNGFLRELAGSAEDPRVDVQLEYSRAKTSKTKLTGDVVLRLANLEEQKHFTFEITDLSYGADKQSITLNPKESKQVLLRLHKSFSWYDINVSVPGAKHFVRHFAGRVETGKAGWSDPAMA